MSLFFRFLIIVALVFSAIALSSALAQERIVPPTDWVQETCDGLGAVLIETLVFQEQGAPLDFILYHAETNHINPAVTAADRLYIFTTMERLYEKPTMDFAREIYQECMYHVKARPKGTPL